MHMTTHGMVRQQVAPLRTGAAIAEIEKPRWGILWSWIGAVAQLLGDVLEITQYLLGGRECQQMHNDSDKKRGR
jgi:hypothetical protein